MTPPEAGESRRFLTLTDVAEILSTSVAQVRALVQSGELRYIQIGGRQQYRIETVELEKYIQRMYAESDAKARRDGTERKHLGLARGTRVVTGPELHEVRSDAAQETALRAPVEVVRHDHRPCLRHAA